MRGLLTTLLILSITMLFACNCAELNTKNAFEQSDVIFTGKLIDREIIMSEISAPKINTKQSYTRVVFTFEVIKTMKGKISSKKIKITSKYQDIDFQKGQKYLIYSYYSEYLLTSNFYINGEKVAPFLVTNICTNTKDYRKVSKKELKKLDRFARRVRIG